MQTFDQWWNENHKLLERRLAHTGRPLLSRREIAHAAWVDASRSFSKNINQTVEENLREALHEI